MNQLDGLRRYLEAATTLTQITRGRAEELVRDLVASGELERTRAQEWIDDLLKRSREASETLLATISAEVDRQLGDRGFKNLDLDDLAQRVAGIIERAGTVGRNVSVPRVWSRGADDKSRSANDASNGTANKESGHKGSGQKGSGQKAKSKSGSGKKKDGSAKSGDKAKKPDAKKSGSKKSEPKKDSSGAAPASTPAESTPAASTPVITDVVAEHSEPGAAT